MREKVNHFYCIYNQSFIVYYNQNITKKMVLYEKHVQASYLCNFHYKHHYSIQVMGTIHPTG